jgi:hypothetical protein
VSRSSPTKGPTNHVAIGSTLAGRREERRAAFFGWRAAGYALPRTVCFRAGVALPVHIAEGRPVPRPDAGCAEGFRLLHAEATVAKPQPSGTLTVVIMHGWSWLVQHGAGVRGGSRQGARLLGL